MRISGRILDDGVFWGPKGSLDVWEKEKLNIRSTNRGRLRDVCGCLESRLLEVCRRRPTAKAGSVWIAPNRIRYYITEESALHKAKALQSLFGDVGRTRPYILSTAVCRLDL